MPTRSFRDQMPGVSLALAMLLAALPWGLPADARFLLPLLPYIVIHFWVVRRPALMPEWLIFLAGLGTDVMTHGPLGYWSLIYLLGFALCTGSRGLTRWGALGRWLQFCVTIVGLAFVQWLVASLYVLSVADWKPLVRSATGLCLLYPLVGMMFRPVLRLWRPAANPSLQRGG